MDPAADPLSHEAAGRSDMSRYVIPAVRLLIQINAADLCTLQSMAQPHPLGGQFSATSHR